jgi:hypothetical protein
MTLEELEDERARLRLRLATLAIKKQVILRESAKSDRATLKAAKPPTIKARWAAINANPAFVRDVKAGHVTLTKLEDLEAKYLPGA